jgi:hypothetical protein
MLYSESHLVSEIHMPHANITSEEKYVLHKTENTKLKIMYFDIWTPKSGPGMERVEIISLIIPPCLF